MAELFLKVQGVKRDPGWASEGVRKAKVAPDRATWATFDASATVECEVLCRSYGKRRNSAQPRVKAEVKVYLSDKAYDQIFSLSLSLSLYIYIYISEV